MEDTHRFRSRVSPSYKRAIELAAQIEGCSVSELVRRACAARYEVA